MIADLQKQLGLDTTFFWQFAIFIFIYLWLSRVLFAPYLELILRRSNQTEGLKDEAQKLDVEAQKKEALYAQKVLEAKRAALAEREKILAAARSQAAVTTDKSRKEAKEKIEAARAVAESAAKAEFKQLEGQAGSLAMSFVEKLTKQKVGV